MVRHLKGVVERDKAPIGSFICATLPTREMEREAAAAGVYEGAGGRSYPKLQIYTLAKYFQGLRPKIPLLGRQAAYKKATRESDGRKQSAFDLWKWCAYKCACGKTSAAWLSIFRQALTLRQPYAVQNPLNSIVGRTEGFRHGPDRPFCPG